MLLAALTAVAAGPIDLGWLMLVVIAVLSLETAKNASGEIFDYRSGADQAVDPEDRSPFSGGKRVLVDGLLTVRQTALVSGLGYAAGIGAGLAIVFLREPRILWLGVVGVACAWFYHAPPLALAYRGLGELAVGLCYGPAIVAGTYLVLRRDLSSELLLLSVPLGLLITAFLWINEFPDYAADRMVGKRTLVVELGKPRAARVFGFLVAGAFVILLGLPILGLPRLIWLGLVGLPPAVAAVGRLLAAPEETRRLIPAQAWSLSAFLLYAVGAGVGMLLDTAF